MKKFLLGVGVITLGATLSSAEYQPPFREGENLTFAIRWGAVTGGYATLGIPAVHVINGKRAYHILSEARSSGVVEAFYKVRDRSESWMEMDIPRTLRYTKKIKEGKYSVDEVVELDQETRTFHMTEVRHDKNGRREEKTGTIPPDVLDVLSSLYYIRTQPLKVGSSYTIDVHSGDKSWPLEVKVKKLEKVKVKAGKFLCYRVEPVLRGPGIFISKKAKKLEVWLTADEARMPVLMRSEIFIGHVSAELVKHVVPPPPDVPQDLAAAPAVITPDSL